MFLRPVPRIICSKNSGNAKITTRKCLEAAREVKKTWGSTSNQKGGYKSNHLTEHISLYVLLYMTIYLYIYMCMYTGMYLYDRIKNRIGYVATIWYCLSHRDTPGWIQKMRLKNNGMEGGSAILRHHSGWLQFMGNLIIVIAATCSTNIKTKQYWQWVGHCLCILCEGELSWNESATQL